MLLQGILYCSLFLTCVAACRFVRSPRARQLILLLASCALYLTWNLWFAAVLLTSIVLNFLMGRWLRRKPSGAILSIGIVLNLSILCFFKYLPEAAITLPSSLQRFSHLALPLGLSFWTFQAMSYLFDLYREEELDPSFIEFALYMSFFPVTISGPICRLPEMLPQFRSRELSPTRNIVEGLRRIALGVLMVLIARLLAQGILGGDGIDSGFDHLSRWSGPDVWCLAFGYGLQLFFDFAGYSHIAIGAAGAMGFIIPENFARPFQSCSPSIFWTRWHMSLSFWIRDYVFLPLATLRREVWWRNLALVIAMLLFGVWHRATWLFVLWGAYHGVLLVLHRLEQQVLRTLKRDPSPMLWNPLAWVVTMTLINLGWILFRGNSLSEARQMWTALLAPATYSSHSLSGSLYFLIAAVAGLYAASVAATHFLNEFATASVDGVPARGIIALLSRSRWYWIPPLYALALIFLFVVTFTRGASTAQFMYNKF